MTLPGGIARIGVPAAVFAVFLGAGYLWATQGAAIVLNLALVLCN